MDEDAFAVDFVDGGGGAQVALLVYEDAEVSSEDGPYADIKLAALVCHRFFNVLLHHPIRAINALLIYEVHYQSKLVENLNPLPLICISRLHNPNILLAVLPRSSLLLRATFGYLRESVH